MTKKKNSLVFLDICIDGDPLERMVFELFSDVPRTAENFRALCTGEKGVGPILGKPLHYKGTFLHHIMKGSMAQGGDLLRKEGSAGESIYGDSFPDDLPKHMHDEPGLLSMSISSRDTRGSIFNLLFKADHNLDRKNLVFGKLVHGFEVLKKIENAGDEDGRPAVTVKIVNCGEISGSDKKKLSKKLGGQASLDDRHKGKHKKSSRDKRKKRRKYYLSESESSSDTELDSTEYGSDSESDTSSSYVNSSGDDRQKKRRRSKRDRHRRGKRRDRGREKKRKRHDKRSRRKSKRALDSLSESGTETSSDNDIKSKDLNQKHDLQKTVSAAENHSLSLDNMATAHNHEIIESSDKLDESGFPKENGEQRVNGYDREPTSGRNEDRQPDVVEDHPDKYYRSGTTSPKRVLSKSMSISPRNRTRSVSRSPRVIKSPPQALPRDYSISRSPIRSASRSPARSLSRTPSRSPSKSPPRSHSRRKVSVSPIKSPPQRSPSPVRSSRRSMTPVRSSHRSISRSSGREPYRRVASRSPVRSPSKRSYRRSYSRSPVRRSPLLTRRRSLSRSGSPTGSPKHVRRGRGFSDRYSFARKYRTPTPDRSRYGGRDSYPSYRRHSDRSPRRYRSPRKSPPRYRSRRSRTRSPSVSRSPPYRRHRYSRSPIRSRSPFDPPRYRASPHAEKRSSTFSQSPSRSPSASPLPRKTTRRSQSRSLSVSSPRKKGLVSYGDGSPDISPR